ncbi:hypothetical protein D3C76_1827400 [compost metagenome]
MLPLAQVDPGSEVQSAGIQVARYRHGEVIGNRDRLGLAQDGDGQIVGHSLLVQREQDVPTNGEV